MMLNFWFHQPFREPWVVLTNHGLVTPYGDKDLGNIGSGNGSLPDGTKQLPEPMLAIIKGFLWHSSESNFTGNPQDIYPWFKF